MSGSGRPTCRTIEVEAGVLPPPATRLVVTQHLRASQDPPFWAWIIVGAFFDEEDNIIWSTEVFAGHLDIQVESDDESDSGESSASETQVGQDNRERPDSASAVHSPDPEAFEHHTYESHDDDDLYHQQRQAIQQNFEHFSINSPLAPPLAWDPTRQGPVPGYWQASFNPAIRRWVHTWQPFC